MSSKRMLTIAACAAVTGCGSGGDDNEPGDVGSYSHDPTFAKTVQSVCDSGVAGTTGIEWDGFTQKLVVTCRNGTVAVVRVPDAVLENK